MSSDIARGVIAKLRKEADAWEWAYEMIKKACYGQILENIRLQKENQLLKNELVKRHAKNRRRA